MKQVLIFSALMSIAFLSCKQKHQPRPLLKSQVYAFFYKDTTQSLFVDNVLEIKGETFAPDPNDSSRNVYKYDSIFYYAKPDSSIKFVSIGGKDSFAIKLVPIPASWVRAVVDKKYYKH